MSAFDSIYAHRVGRCNPSAIRELLKVAQRPDVISFAGGMPAPELFPFEGMEAAAAQAFSSRQLAVASLAYGISEGYLPLRRAIAESLAEEGIQATEHNILITTGSQQALDMIAKLLLDPGDHVVVGNPTFLGALQSFNSYEAEYLTIPLDAGGMSVPALAETLANGPKPKFIYTIPSFQNPTGLSLQEERKAAIYELARQHGVPVVEDDPYGDLYYDGERPTTIKRLDVDGDHVILLRTFSKVLAPGLRLGYMVMGSEWMSRFLPIKQSADLHSSALNQVMVHEFLQAGGLAPHLDRVRPIYAARRDLMLDLMAEHFPREISWTKPAGGMFVWVTMPEGLSAKQLLDRALATEKVSFVPGEPFYALGGGENCFRLNFSCPNEENMRLGIQKLAKVLHEALAEAKVAQ